MKRRYRLILSSLLQALVLFNVEAQEPVTSKDSVVWLDQGTCPILASKQYPKKLVLENRARFAVTSYSLSCFHKQKHSYLRSVDFGEIRVEIPPEKMVVQLDLDVIPTQICNSRHDMLGAAKVSLSDGSVWESAYLKNEKGKE